MPHPSLEFAVPPTNTPVTHIGIENIRYHDEWSDDEVKRRLSSDALTMILGGSTTFGHYVKNDETWPYYFDRMIAERGEVSLNFGTIADDQEREIDRLVLELRRGVRPRRVIFLDGLNDMFLIASSNLRAGDRLLCETFMPNRGEVAVSGGLRLGQRNWWRLSWRKRSPRCSGWSGSRSPEPLAEQNRLRTRRLHPEASTSARPNGRAISGTNGRRRGRRSCARN